MLSLILSKVAGSIIGKFVTANLFWVILSLFLALSTVTGWYMYQSAKFEGKYTRTKEKLDNKILDYDVLTKAIDNNEQALQMCLAVNAKNAANLEKQKAANAKLSKEIAILQTTYINTVGDIRNEAEKLRGQDKECRSVDQPLPDWFTSGVCSRPENCVRAHN